MASADGFYISAGEGEAYAFGGGVTTFKVRGEDTDGHFEIVELQVGDRVVHAGPGACVFSPSGQAHRFANPNDAPARWLQVDSIGGREAMFKEMAEKLPKDSPADPAEMIQILAEYETRPASPR